MGICSLVFGLDLNSRGQWFTLVVCLHARVCVCVILSVRLIFPVENRHVTLVILEAVGRVEIVAGDVF